MLVLALVVVAALGVRIWHDNRAHNTPPALTAEEIERRAQEQPNSLQAQLDWGNLLAKTGHLQEAASVFAHAAQIAPQDARPYTWLGILAVQDHRPDFARVNFEQSVKLNPSQPEVWHALGELYEQARASHRAIDAYEQAVRLNPNDETAWRQLGVLSIEANQQARGRAALLRATQLKPDDEAAQIDLGNSDLVQGQLPEAKQAFDSVLAHHPDDPEALVGSAEAAIQLDPSPESLSRAEQQVGRALALQPIAHAHLVLGRIDLMRRDYGAAVKEFQTTLRMSPTQMAAYAYLSQAYGGLRRPDLARKAGEDYQRAYAASKQRRKQAEEANR